MADNEKSAMQRRTLIRGAAWAVPSLAVAAAAPAIAASQQCTVVTNDYQYQGNEVFVTVPPEAQYVDYIVRGAGGGSAGSSGQGARTEGRITFANASSPRQFVVIVGQGGAVTRNGTTAAGGYGYGRGGSSTPGPRATDSAATGGGGGGSAILLQGSRTPVIVSGGGGGSAITHSVQGSTKVVQTHFQPGLTNPDGGSYQYGRGSAGTSGNGRAGGMGGQNATATGLATSPALAGAGGNGGRGGGGSMYRAGNFAAPYDWSQGTAGGDHGSAVNGGGNGGDGAPRLTNNNTFQASAGGGGGGYAGGGGGGIVSATFGNNNLRTLSAGSGAAGSNYVMSSAQGLVISNDGFENAGLEGPENRGHPGFIRLSWCV